VIAFEIKSYRDAGCTMLAVQKDAAAMTLVHEVTGGKLCDTGCAAFRNGNCAAYRRMIGGLPAQIVHSETVKQEAARLGVSLSEIRRRRNSSAIVQP